MAGGVEDLDLFDLDNLNSIEDFKRLTDLQKQILFSHVKDPNLSKEKLAENLGVKKSVVYKLFNSKAFETINEEFAQQKKREILQLAIKTMRECLLSKKDTVRLAAATRVLEDAGVFKVAPKSVKTDNKMIVLWSDKTKVNEVVEVAPEKIT